MACRLVALDKQPCVRPVGIGEIFRRLIAKCILVAVGHQAMEACERMYATVAPHPHQQLGLDVQLSTTKVTIVSHKQGVV